MPRVLASTNANWPPGLTRAAVAHCPPELRSDAVQAAWLAHAEGRKPDTAVRALLRHEVRHQVRHVDLERCATDRVRRRF